jgi:hypothetical protein
MPEKCAMQDQAPSHLGHVKQDHGMNRNHLKGAEGDRIHALLCGCGFNIAKLLAVIFLRLLYMSKIRAFGRLILGRHENQKLITA